MLKTAKGILLLLFLYLALVWTLAFYLNRGKPSSSDAVIVFGLRYTIVGLATLFLILLGSWLFGYWKAYRARASTRPKPAPAAGPRTPVAGQEDDEALKLLLNEAAARLMASPSFARNDRGPDLVFSGMPLYLVVGVEGSGKTSTIANSGLDPELLAGQPRLEKSSPSSTGLANIWLAADALFIEIGGRHFVGDSRRWTELLRVLAAKPKIPFWRRVWKGDVPGFDLRGIIHCSELRFFLSKPGPEQIERQSQLTQERLRTIIKVFGRILPVFTVFTKADQIPYFRDYFGRFSEREAEQILGSTLALPESDGVSDQAAFATSEAKRISKSFNALYTSLTERRLSVLFHEPNAGKKSRIYEFPREFNRIRQNIVDFLVQTFRPSPLEPTPVNRGFYFSGTREVEPLPTASDTSARGSDTINIPFQQAMDATFVFRGDPADLMKGAGADVDLQVTRVRRGGFQTRWAFLSALFRDVISRDRSVESFAPTVSAGRFGNSGTLGFAIVLCVSVILGLFWTVSWIQNASLVRSVDSGTSTLAASIVSPGELPTIQELTSLDSLRKQVEELNDYERTSSVWNLWHLTMRFGLYEVGELSDPVRDAYFQRLNSSLLALMQDKLTSYLKSLGKSGNESANASDRLKAYMMISDGGKCNPPEPSVVTAGLTAMLQMAGVPPNDPRSSLASQQFSFYANQLKFGNPVHLSGDSDAESRAVQYLSSLSNEEQHYRQLLSSVARELGGVVQFDLRHDHVLTASTYQVSFAFTPMGWESFKSRLDKEDFGSAVDPCILIASGNKSDKDTRTKFSDKEKSHIQDRYAREYFMAWRELLAQFHIAPFNSAHDAAQRLDVLAGNRSPLLGLFRFVAENTTFSRLEPDTADVGILGSIKDLAKFVSPPPGVQFTLNGVANSFQPVSVVVPPNGDLWITDKNRSYMDALGRLQHAMEDIDEAPQDPQGYKKLKEADTAGETAIDGFKHGGFNSNAVGRVDELVIGLLREPFFNIRRFEKNDDEIKGTIIVTKMKTMCDKMTQVVLNKYPFASQSANDLSLGDFSEWFKPDTGIIWAEQQNSLSKLVLRGENKIWKPAPSDDVKPTPDMLNFLNKAQAITSAFFTDPQKPGINYTLRPNMANTTQVLEFNLDGDEIRWDDTNHRQHDFSWTGKASNSGFVGKAGAKGNTVPFTSGSGIWGIFKMFHEAERSEDRFTWTKASGTTGLLQPSVQLEFVRPTPGLVDVFDRTFFSDFRCPRTVVQ